MEETLKNDERFKIDGDKRVRVTVEFRVNEDVTVATTLRNAAMALTRQADLGNMHVWVDKIVVEDA